jgi:hypothetical protein
MLHLPFRLGLVAAFLLASLVVAFAQDRDRADIIDEMNQKDPPKTVAQFWRRMKTGLAFGEYESTARLIRGLLARKPSDADLLAIVAKEKEKRGIEVILRELESMPQWSSDPKVEKQAREDVKTLVARFRAAQRKTPNALRDEIARLRGTPEQRAYALGELRHAGALAMPVLIEALMKSRTAEERLPVIQALEGMGPVAVAPMIAALDSDDFRAKLDLLDILRRRYLPFRQQIVPHLWFPSANPAENSEVRRKATALLADMLDIPASRLMPARVALTREAQRFYQHEVKFTDPTAVVIWRWTGKGVVQGWPGAPTVPASQAEEYWGLRFARQALTLDPTYRPAQVVFLSLAIDKAAQRGGLGVPLSRSDPRVAQLVAKASTDLLLDMLERALTEQRTSVALAVARALGDRAEVRAKRPTGRGDPALVRALYYPDQRVQLTAVESLLLIPGPVTPRSGTRIVELLARMLSPAAAARPGPKVIVGVFEEEFRTRARTAAEEVRLLGNPVEPIVVSNGRDLMREVRARGDVDAILMTSVLPQPGLANLLAQLRADVDAGKVPVLLAAVPETRTSHDVVARAQVIDRRLNAIKDDTRSYHLNLRRINDEEATRLGEISKDKTLKKEERREAEDVVREKYALERNDLEKTFLGSVRLLRVVPKLEREKYRLGVRYALESEAREEQLARYTDRYPNVYVVQAPLFTDARALEARLTAAVRQAGVALTPEERARQAGIAIQILSKLAQGQPPGYDVRPATGVILDALRTGRLAPDDQIAAIDAAARLPGARSQVELAHTILDAARPEKVRIAAGEGLVLSLQRYGVQLTEGQLAPVRALARQDKLPARLKAQLGAVIGALRPDARTTGERLKRFDPQPVAPLAPPPK